MVDHEGLVGILEPRNVLEPREPRGDGANKEQENTCLMRCQDATIWVLQDILLAVEEKAAKDEHGNHQRGCDTERHLETVGYARHGVTCRTKDQMHVCC